MRAILVLLLSVLVASPAFAAKKQAAKKYTHVHKVAVHNKKGNVKRVRPAPRVVVKQAAPKMAVRKVSPACVALNLSRETLVSPETDGYQVVQVEFDIPVAEGKKPADEAAPMTITFGVHYAGTGIKPDRDTYIKDIGVCTRDHTTPDGKFYPAGTTWLRVGLVPDQEGNTGATYRIAAELPLPEPLVEEKPHAYTSMLSGFYEARWMQEGTSVPVLRFTRQY